MTGDDFIPSLYSQVIAKSRYSRWIEEEKRRETWEETVDRYIEAMVKRVEEAEEP